MPRINTALNVLGGVGKGFNRWLPGYQNQRIRLDDIEKERESTKQQRDLGNMVAKYVQATSKGADSPEAQSAFTELMNSGLLDADQALKIQKVHQDLQAKQPKAPEVPLGGPAIRGAGPGQGVRIPGRGVEAMTPSQELEYTRGIVAGAQPKARLPAAQLARTHAQTAAARALTAQRTAAPGPTFDKLGNQYLERPTVAGGTPRVAYTAPGEPPKQEKPLTAKDLAGMERQWLKFYEDSYNRRWTDRSTGYQHPDSPPMGEWVEERVQNKMAQYGGGNAPAMRYPDGPGESGMQPVPSMAGWRGIPYALPGQEQTPMAARQLPTTQIQPQPTVAAVPETTRPQIQPQVAMADTAQTAIGPAGEVLASITAKPNEWVQLVRTKSVELGITEEEVMERLQLPEAAKRILRGHPR